MSQTQERGEKANKYFGKTQALGGGGAMPKNTNVGAFYITTVWQNVNVSLSTTYFRLELMPNLHLGQLIYGAYL